MGICQSGDVASGLLTSRSSSQPDFSALVMLPVTSLPTNKSGCPSSDEAGGFSLQRCFYGFRIKFRAKAGDLLNNSWEIVFERFINLYMQHLMTWGEHQHYFSNNKGMCRTSKNWTNKLTGGGLCKEDRYTSHVARISNSTPARDQNKNLISFTIAK